MKPADFEVRFFIFDTLIIIFWIKAYVNGLIYITRQTTVPQIFICGEFIGGIFFLSTRHWVPNVILGYTELNKLKQQDSLLDLVKKCSNQY